ncbi:YbfB/YjiJ family MFS transporter [Micromonospora sp. BQ11]|uniref:YbfB/YjiJ family MFS transporter n=1 Tax=Micromonospora sp. BQ11 TaxID=3452212 RepID=UPI003F8CC5EA
MTSSRLWSYLPKRLVRPPRRAASRAEASRSPILSVIHPAVYAIAYPKADYDEARLVFEKMLTYSTHLGLYSASGGATLAPGNYVGYLVGALLGILAPRLAGSATTMRVALVVTVLALAARPLTTSLPVWMIARGVSGVASSLVFVVATSAMLSRLRGSAPQLAGWGFGGIGAGLALSGLLILAIHSTLDWRAAWMLSAAMATVFAVLAWSLSAAEGPAADAPVRTVRHRTHRWFWWAFASYSVEGVGYIIAGTFLVAAIKQAGQDRVGYGAWVIVGIAALPGAALWAALARRWSRPTLMVAALILQAIGLALPALLPGAVAAVVAALFGGTFVGISNLALAIGTHLRLPRAVALLTSGYAVGQITGPLIVEPLLGNGYQTPLLIGAGIVALAALAAAALRLGFPHRVGDMIEPSRASL